MNNFNGAIQQKRKKMLVLALLLFLLPFLNVSATINLTYILKKDQNKVEPRCIAEELERYAAIGWVYPLPASEAEIPQIHTKFIPSIQNDYNCNFSKNDICNTRWSNIDWHIDESSTKTREFVGDIRWEELPTIWTSNSTKEFKDRIEIEGASKAAFSVRTSGPVEVLLCTGWNPYNYPCYHFHIDTKEIYFNKYSMLPKELNQTYKVDSLEYYKAYTNILSPDEWRNFVVSFNGNGTMELIDINLNRTVIEHNDDSQQSFQPMYLLIRSNNTSLWKIHQNNFLYTKTTQKSRLGPQLSFPNKDLCVSLLVTMCNNCKMNFFYKNGTVLKSLKTINSESQEWFEIKLKEENIQHEKLNLYVETTLIDETLSDTDGYWAIDNIRVCNENEVKVTYLKLNETFKEDDLIDEIFSCQLIKKPSWRPRKLIYNQIKDFPEITPLANSTAIMLSWNEEDPQHELNYFVSYQANDICGEDFPNLKRLKSNGFVSTKFNEIVLTDLIPYTWYNITVSTVLHENDKILYVSTLEPEEPTLGEYPSKIQVRPSDTELYVSWEKPSCVWRYGRLIYTLIVTNEKQNFTKKLEFQTENQYRIDGLTPFTSYTLTILTARNARNMNKGIHTHTVSLPFTTMSGVAPDVENLELYSVSNDSANLRFDLPEATSGIPSEVQVSRCNALSAKKCKSLIKPIERCKLWPKKYCVDVQYLIPNQEYVFKVSVKNQNTHTFGKEVLINGYTKERIPGKPSNITYKVVDCQQSTDYCHLNITWLHPYYQNGTITLFDIVLNSTNKHLNSEEYKNIHEVYKIVNDTYMPAYTYQIKYVPYSANYDLHIQSRNMKYHSGFTTVPVKTAEIGDHIDQSPKLLGKSDSALIFKLPHLDRRLDSYLLTIVVQDFNVSQEVPDEIRANEKINDNLCHNFGDTWISENVTVTNNDTDTATVATSIDEVKHIKPDTQYCIIFIITNRYKESEHDVVYYEKLHTLETPQKPKEESSTGSFNHLYMLLLLLLLVPIGFFLYRYLRKKRVISKPPEANENVYESLPFEENCVSNDNYDHLLHK